MEFECSGRTFSRQDFNNLRLESPNLFKWCVEVIQENVEFRHSKSQYLPWSKKLKISELENSQTRVVVLFESTGKPVAFLSYQIDRDPKAQESKPNLYIYELHVIKEFRGLGLGTFLIKMVDTICRDNPEKCHKIMLTAFKPLKNNRLYKSPIDFYTRHGFKPDPSSPSQCLKARDAAVYDYEIMSKEICDQI